MSFFSGAGWARAKSVLFYNNMEWMLSAFVIGSHSLRSRRAGSHSLISQLERYRTWTTLQLKKGERGEWERRRKLINCCELNWERCCCCCFVEIINSKMLNCWFNETLWALRFGRWCSLLLVGCGIMSKMKILLVSLSSHTYLIQLSSWSTPPNISLSWRNGTERKQHTF